MVDCVYQRTPGLAELQYHCEASMGLDSVPVQNNGAKVEDGFTSLLIGIGQATGFVGTELGKMATGVATEVANDVYDYFVESLVNVKNVVIGGVASLYNWSKTDQEKTAVEFNYVFSEKNLKTILTNASEIAGSESATKYKLAERTELASVLRHLNNQVTRKIADDEKKRDDLNTFDPRKRGINSQISTYKTLRQHIDTLLTSINDPSKTTEPVSLVEWGLVALMAKFLYHKEVSRGKNGDSILLNIVTALYSESSYSRDVLHKEIFTDKFTPLLQNDVKLGSKKSTVTTVSAGFGVGIPGIATAGINFSGSLEETITPDDENYPADWKMGAVTISSEAKSGFSMAANLWGATNLTFTAGRYIEMSTIRNFANHFLTSYSEQEEYRDHPDIQPYMSRSHLWAHLLQQDQKFRLWAVTRNELADFDNVQAAAKTSQRAAFKDLVAFIKGAETKPEQPAPHSDVRAEHFLYGKVKTATGNIGGGFSAGVPHVCGGGFSGRAEYSHLKIEDVRKYTCAATLDTEYRSKEEKNALKRHIEREWKKLESQMINNAWATPEKQALTTIGNEVLKMASPTALSAVGEEISKMLRLNNFTPLGVKAMEVLHKEVEGDALHNDTDRTAAFKEFLEAKGLSTELMALVDTKKPTDSNMSDADWENSRQALMIKHGLVKTTARETLEHYLQKNWIVGKQRSAIFKVFESIERFNKLSQTDKKLGYDEFVAERDNLYKDIFNVSIYGPNKLLVSDDMFRDYLRSNGLNEALFELRTKVPKTSSGATERGDARKAQLSLLEQYGLLDRTPLVKSRDLTGDEIKGRFRDLKRDFDEYSRLKKIITLPFGFGDTEQNRASLEAFHKKYGVKTTEQLLHRMIVANTYLFIKAQEKGINVGLNETQKKRNKTLQESLLSLEKKLYAPNFAIDDKYMGEHAYYLKVLKIETIHTLKTKSTEGNVFGLVGVQRRTDDRIYKRIHHHGVRLGDYWDNKTTYTGKLSDIETVTNGIANQVTGGNFGDWLSQQLGYFVPILQGVKEVTTMDRRFLLDGIKLLPGESKGPKLYTRTYQSQISVSGFETKVPVSPGVYVSGGGQRTQSRTKHITDRYTGDSFCQFMHVRLRQIPLNLHTEWEDIKTKQRAGFDELFTNYRQQMGNRTTRGWFLQREMDRFTQDVELSDVSEQRKQDFRLARRKFAEAVMNYDARYQWSYDKTLEAFDDFMKAYYHSYQALKLASPCFEQLPFPTLEEIDDNSPSDKISVPGVSFFDGSTSESDDVFNLTPILNRSGNHNVYPLVD